MTSVRWIEHCACNVLYVDFRGAKSLHDVLEIQESAEDHLSAVRGPVPILVHVVESNPRPQLASRAEELDEGGRVRKKAFVGIAGLERLRVELEGRFTTPAQRVFDDEAEALDWLVG
ncbi:STAS/SEC14 domain-containing protein [Myxococcota bacterium]|nr:STAS/SEC14 domain-containing protein [Myxococcota bacterium]